LAHLIVNPAVDEPSPPIKIQQSSFTGKQPGTVCVSCGLSQLTLMSARDPAASPHTLAVAMVGLAAAACVCMLSWHRSLQKPRPAATSKLAKEAMTEENRNLFASRGAIALKHFNSPAVIPI
jgi:hypothetical protein